MVACAFLRDKEFNLELPPPPLQDGEFRTYLVEELLVDERDADSCTGYLPMDLILVFRISRCPCDDHGQSLASSASACTVMR